MDDVDFGLNVHMFMFILLPKWMITMVILMWRWLMLVFILLLRWVDERKEQEEVEALREEVSGEMKLIF